MRNNRQVHYSQNEKLPTQDEKRASWQNALNRWQEIFNRYPNCPSVEALDYDEDKIAWLNNKIRMCGECIAATKDFLDFKFRFLHFFRRGRNDRSHEQEDQQFLEQNIFWLEWFSEAKRLKTFIEKRIKDLSSSNPTIRSFEEQASSRIGSQRDIKQLVDSLRSELNPRIKPEDKVPMPKRQAGTLAADETGMAKQAVYTSGTGGSSDASENLRDADVVFAAAQAGFTPALEDIVKPATQAQQDLFEYAQEHAGLHDSILIDIIEWIRRMEAQLFRENPFLHEELFITKLHRITAEKLTGMMLEPLAQEYAVLPTVAPLMLQQAKGEYADFLFYQENLAKIESVENNTIVKAAGADDESKQAQVPDSTHSKETLLRNLVHDVDTAYITRKIAWELAEIEKSRKAFTDALFEKIARFRQLEQLISPFINNLGYLWDLSNTPFQDCGFELLQQYADLLEKDEFLRELATLLGRQHREQLLYEQEYRARIENTDTYTAPPAYRGDITGLRLSNDIPATLPSELALYNNADTEKYFMLKFAEKQLLAYAYQQKYAGAVNIHPSGKQAAPEITPKGPVLMCVDTSASMHGLPEQIAKTVTFALTKIALEEKRPCFLISFSAGIETLDLSSFKDSDSLIRLTAFLRKNFNGGTDPAPALKHAVQLLHQKDWQNADVLMVSDFIMETIPNELEQYIQAERQKQTGFYSLVIGSAGNPETLTAFDQKWVYNPRNTRAQKELVQQLACLRERY